MTDRGTTRAEQLTRYIDGQMTERETLAFEQELAADATLRAEAGQLRATKLRLRNAVLSQALPADLEQKIRNQTVSRSFAISFLDIRSFQLAGALALTLFLALGGWLLLRNQNYTLSDLPAEVAGMLRIGAGEHVHCVKDRIGSSVYGIGKFNSPVPEEDQKIFEAARRVLPADYQVVEVHVCGSGERRFAHLVAARGGDYLSLLLTQRQQDDPEPTDSRYSVATVNGIRIFAAKTRDGLAVDGFTLSTQYAFVVSGQDARENLRLTKGIAAAVE